MTPKADLIGRIEDYVLDLMDANEKLEFERELQFNQELKDEVELHKNLQAAVLELDVLNLKGKLQEIQQKSISDISDNGSFSLLEDLDEIQELTDELTFEELINSFESLPKVHVYQHGNTSNENIHHFYKEQESAAEVNGFEDELNGFELEELEGLEEAILETDILNLRETLQQVAKSVEPKYSVEEIDEYLSGEMGADILAEFEMEMMQNKQLLDEVGLHREVETALGETDIMDLRNEIRNIMNSETSWNVGERTIEDFIDGMLAEDLLEEFNAELKENTDLMAEVSLREHINRAIGEKEIMSLREQLAAARNDADKKEVKSIIMPHFDLHSTRFWRNSVAMIIVLIGLAGILNTGMQSVDKTYSTYFESPSWASERSVNSSNLDVIQTAQLFYQQDEFQKVIDILNPVASQGKDAFVEQFYLGLSYQHLDQYPQAIQEYDKVIQQGNNLFVEEAEWYKALCYLKANQKLEAKNELLAVIDRKGHYEKDAKAILRKLRFSLK